MVPVKIRDWHIIGFAAFFALSHIQDCVHSCIHSSIQPSLVCSHPSVRPSFISGFIVAFVLSSFIHSVLLAFVMFSCVSFKTFSLFLNVFVQIIVQSFRFTITFSTPEIHHFPLLCSSTILNLCIKYHHRHGPRSTHSLIYYFPSFLHFVLLSFLNLAFSHSDLHSSHHSIISSSLLFLLPSCRP